MVEILCIISDSAVCQKFWDLSIVNHIGAIPTSGPSLPLRNNEPNFKKKISCVITILE